MQSVILSISNSHEISGIFTKIWFITNNPWYAFGTIQNDYEYSSKNETNGWKM